MLGARALAVAAASMGVVASWVQGAVAEEQLTGAPVEVPAKVAWYLPLGFNVGAAVHQHAPLGLTLGAEISGVLLSRNWSWFGVYADALHDFGTKENRGSVGLELGYRYLGIDGGYLLVRESDGSYGHGVVVRPLATTGLVSLFGRLGYVLTGERRAFVEVGALLKYPIDLDG